jgi:lysozyme
MKLSDAGLDLIKRFEGLRLKSYKCSAGVWTIGYGSTRIWGRPVEPDDAITDAQADDFLRQDVAKFESAVNSVVRVPLTQNQFDALVSFTYNLGEGNLKRSTLVRLLNDGNYHSAADEFLRWNMAAGVVVPGLTRRRAAERALFLQGMGAHFPVADLPPYPGAIPPPIPTPDPLPPVEAPMPIPVPLITAAAQALLPFVADLFKKHGGDTAERNAAIIEKAGPILVEAAKVATGEKSIEGALSAVTDKPEAREAFRKQVEAQWFEIAEAGGGGIEGARKFNLEAGKPFWMMPAFWVSMSLLPLLYGTVWAVLAGSGEAFSGELKAAIASSVVTGILGSVVGFWLGSSFTTSKSRGLGASPTQ